MVFNHDKRIQNGLNQITLDYQSRGFKVISTFGNGVIKNLIKWTRHELHMDLTTYNADSHIARAKNSIKFVKERLKSV